MAKQNLLYKKFSRLCYYNETSTYFTLKTNGFLFEVVVFHYHYYYIYVKRIGGKFPMIFCRVKGSNCLNDYLFKDVF